VPIMPTLPPMGGTLRAYKLQSIFSW